MKIQIDTELKAITVIEDCTLSELYDYAMEHNLFDYEIKLHVEWYYYPTWTVPQPMFNDNISTTIDTN